MRTSCVLMSLRSPAKWNHWKVNKHNCWDLSVESWDFSFKMSLCSLCEFSTTSYHPFTEYKYREVLLTLFIMLRKRVNKRKLSLTHFRSQKSNLTKVFLWKQKSVKFLFSKWEKKSVKTKSVKFLFTKWEKKNLWKRNLSNFVY